MKFKKKDKAYNFFLDARIYYSIALIGIITWVPWDRVSPNGRRRQFEEYDWIFYIGYMEGYQINYIFLGIEFLVITILFFLFKKK